MSIKPPAVLEFAEDTDQLVNEYSSFVKSMRIDPDIRAKVYITTLEDVDLIIHVSSGGWEIVKVGPETVAPETRMLQSECYEGAEALLMAASVGFTKKWHEQLIEKLFALGGSLEDEEEIVENNA